MWSTAQSDQIFGTFVEHPRRTTVIAAATPGGPRFRDAEATTAAAAIRAHADEARIPIVVRTLAAERQPGHAHVVVHHVPDVTGDADAALDSWDNEGGAQHARPLHETRSG